MQNNITKQEIVTYLNENPYWLVGFVNGEGCFTASFFVDPSNTWGIQLSFEFNIVQKDYDIELLEAILVFLGVQGNAFVRKNQVASVAVRNIKFLRANVRPFFDKYSLLGLKNPQYNQWCKIIDITLNLNYNNKTIASRDLLGKILDELLILNSNRLNEAKNIRNRVLYQWLEDLNNIPGKSKFSKYFKN